MTDAAVARRCETAWKYLPMVRAIVGPQAAEDIVQNVCVKFCEQPHACDPEQGDEEAWVRTVLVNAARDWLRRRRVTRKRLASLDDEEVARQAEMQSDRRLNGERVASELPDEPTIDRDLEAEFKAARPALDATHSAALEVYLTAGSIKRGAEAVGVGYWAFASRVRRARMALRAVTDAPGPSGTPPPTERPDVATTADRPDAA